MADEIHAVPTFNGTHRSQAVRLPQEIQKVSGIHVLGRTIRSFICTTDIAIIRNCDADAVFAVYPFTPQQVISKMLVEASSIPVFVGVGGGRTSGKRSLMFAKDAEAAGAYGVVMNAPVCNDTVKMVSSVVGIPVVVTVVNDNLDVVRARIDAGASIINVAAGKDTPAVARKIRDAFPGLPLIASGGCTSESISNTAAAGVNSIVCNPPSIHSIVKAMMDDYRSSNFDLSTISGGKSFPGTGEMTVDERLHQIMEDDLPIA